MEWRYNRKSWYFCLRCHHIHVPIRLNGLIRWVCVYGKYTRIARKHGLAPRKPRLPAIQQIKNEYLDNRLECAIDYNKLGIELNKLNTYEPTKRNTHNTPFLIAMPMGQRA